MYLLKLRLKMGKSSSFSGDMCREKPVSALQKWLLALLLASTYLEFLFWLLLVWFWTPTVWQQFYSVYRQTQAVILFLLPWIGRFNPAVRQKQTIRRISGPHKVQWDFVYVRDSCAAETRGCTATSSLPASEATCYCRMEQVWVCQDGRDWWASTVWKIFTFYRAALITFTPWMCRSREINLGVFLCRCRRPSYVTWAEASCAGQTSMLPNANTIGKHSCNSSISVQLFGLPCGFPAYHRSWADVLFAISVWQ